jgi:hypothetical protein
LHTGPEGLGLLRAAPAIGAATVAAVLVFYSITRHVGRWMLAGVAVLDVANIVFGLSESFLLSMAALTLLGIGDMVSVYTLHLLGQLKAPDNIRGRVSAVSSVFIGASIELGEFESGLAAAWLGLVPAVIIGDGANGGFTC